MKKPKLSIVFAKGGEDEDEDEDEGASELEVQAMEAFEAAKTTEEKASAMKAFIKACMDEEEY